MEEQRIYRTSRFIKRLLISFSFITLFIFFSNQLFSKDFTENEYEGNTEKYNKDFLLFKAVENQNFFINNDIQFEINIPDISPEEIQFFEYNHTDKETISKNSSSETDINLEIPFTFSSMKKYELLNEKGTDIHIWYSFNEKGTYTIPPINVFIKGKETKIMFEQVTIREDPEKMLPKIVLKFSNGTELCSDDDVSSTPVFTAYTGKKLNFTVYMQYTSKLLQFNFDIPKNSIYKQIKTYEITNKNYIEKNISDKLVPVADFEWMELAAGLHTVPKFKITAIGNNDIKTELIMPEFIVNFISLNNNNEIKNNENIFNDAFEESFFNKDTSEKINITLEDCEKLADLHKKEKNAVFTKNKYKKARAAFEEQLGLPVSKGYFNTGILYFLIAITIAAIILLIIAINRKYVLRIFIFSILLFLSSIFIIFSSQKIKNNSAITKNCTIYSIPENSAEAFSEIAPGNLVLITEKTDNWYHIQLGETSGWCLKDNIIVIK